MSKDLFESPIEIDQPVLERFPAMRIGSKTTATLSANTVRDSADWSGFLGHRDTFALRELHRCASRHQELPNYFFRRLLQYIDFDAYLSLRLSCRCWSAAITGARPLTFTTSSPKRSLPAAILQQIYSYLSPVDFNAARHACWQWMDASLNYRLLTRMLERGSWRDAARADIVLHEEFGAGPFANEEWLLSKRLATECSLRPDWTGNGLDDSATQYASASHLKHSSSPQDGRCALRSFFLVSEIDFSLLNASQNRGGDNHSVSTLQFTSSICGKYLLVTKDCTIYLYFLNHEASGNYHPQSPKPVEALTYIVCPYRVIAVSMDTSSHRLAVAALLEGRVGLNCDLHVLGAALRRPASSARWESLASIDKFGYLNNTNDHPNTSSPTPTSKAMDGSSRRTSSDYSTHPDPVSNSHSPPHTFINRIVPSFQRGSFTMYYNLCSAIDPPLSIAICARRQCVAFGCSTAVELHWVDALTGQRLNRSFPISGGVGALYFFPIREDEKRLRVIGSGAVPLWWNGEESEVRSGIGKELRMDCQSHSGRSHYFNAIPLSNGSHVLFTKFMTGELCLGIEQRSIKTGIDTTRLNLEIVAVLEMPSLSTEIAGKDLPQLYEVGRDLRWGARVVVAFNDELWFFAVPGDLLRIPSVENRGIADEGERQIAMIRGICVGMVEGLVRVGVCADGGGVLVWGINRLGLMREWRIGARGSRERWVVRSDGEVVERFVGYDDNDADVRTFANDHGTKSVVANSPRESDRPVTYDADGDVVMSGTEQADAHDFCFRRDADGDVIMSDADTAELAADGSHLQNPCGSPDEVGDLDLDDEGYVSGEASDNGVVGVGVEVQDLDDEGYFLDDDDHSGVYPAFVAEAWQEEGESGVEGGERKESWSEDVRVEVVVLGCAGE